MVSSKTCVEGRRSQLDTLRRALARGGADLLLPIRLVRHLIHEIEHSYLPQRKKREPVGPPRVSADREESPQPGTTLTLRRSRSQQA